MPERIVYIRDGVGDDQMARIIQEEWATLKDVCVGISPGYNPWIVFVLAQKSHSTRMFLQGGDVRFLYPICCTLILALVNDLLQKGNVRMATALCSSSGVTVADMNEFYLVGQKALQGTAKPLRYVLLKQGFAKETKDAKCPKEFELTECSLYFYFMSYWYLAHSHFQLRLLIAALLIRELMGLHLMNARAQKGCRLPAPIKHAHLAAERAAVHAQDNMRLKMHILRIAVI